MWIAAVIATMSSVVAHLHESYGGIHSYLVAVAFFAMAVGLGGFQATIIQFGLDQLHDASTSEIKSFIIWFVWTAYCQGIPMDFGFTCLGKASRIYKLLFVCVNLSLAMILVYTCNHCLIKEPIKQNPLKLVYKVISYAIRNKYPRQRSAFTYCEDELPSRIDFGKSKYGGPFTTEQVEDVKTFLRFIPLAIVGGVLGGSILVSNNMRDRLYNQFRDISISESKFQLQVTKCYFEASFTHTIYYGAAILIPLYEIVIYPVFYICCPWMESQRKISVGMVALIAKVLTLMAYNIISRHTYSLQMNGPNITTPCLFESSKGAFSTSFSY
jgi:peptide/histidine transporter 3/4